MSYDELSIGTCTLCVDDTFRNALAVEVCKKINEMEVLK
jgi:hypothetical protein